MSHCPAIDSAPGHDKDTRQYHYDRNGMSGCKQGSAKLLILWHLSQHCVRLY